jgi:hypothetical protein
MATQNAFFYPVLGSLDGTVEKDGTFYITKDGTEMESSSPFFV